MALRTYTELVASISAWLDGSDLGGREADLIALCEDEINARLAAALRDGAFIRPMAVRGHLSIHAEYVDLPDAETVLPISIEIGGLDAPWEVRFIAADKLAALTPMEGRERAVTRVAAGADVPRFYSVIGDELRFFPVPQSTLLAEFTRFVRVPALSEEVASNWVLDSHRNAYLYGTLAQAELFGWNDSRMSNLATLFEQAVDGIVARYPVPADRPSLTSDVAWQRRCGPAAMSDFLAGEL